MQQYNIIQLLKLLDKYVYSYLPSIDNDVDIRVFIPNSDILQFFESIPELLNSMNVYAQTLIEIIQSEVEYHPLVRKYEISNTGLNIEHNIKALKYYLYRDNNVIIYNGAIQLLFAKAFAKYNFNGELIYSFLSKGYEYKCTPDELRTLLQMNYQNSFLLPRVLRPAESAIQELFDKDKIPFYFTTMLEKSMLGTGRKIIGIKFEVKDYVVALRQARLKLTYIDFIVDSLKELFPWDFPFYKSKIEVLNDSTIELIYKMIKNIESDPDYNKIATSSLVKYKLSQDFDILIQLD